jgi:8-oxo-dGTP pyrophosphatase MutT (NUDIX family)
MSNVPTERQVSAGGVAYRQHGETVEVALIAVGQKNRWQLPKGLVDEAESPAQTAVREVREEAGIATELLEPIDAVEYWYYGQRQGRRVRYHKFVHFFLLRFVDGDVCDHDHEVNEARWVAIDEAVRMLAFAGEKNVVQKAAALIAARL